MTRIILFIHQNAGEKGKTFLKILRNNVNDTRIETCSGIEILEKKLLQRKSSMGKEIIVLFADNADRMDQLYLKKDLLLTMKTVIVLPTDDPETISGVYRFFPRYFCFMDDRYDDLCEVLNKMVMQ